MKKLKSILLLCTFSIIMMFTLTACGEQETSADGSVGTSTENEFPDNNGSTTRDGDGLVNDAKDAVDDVTDGVRDILTGDDNNKSNNKSMKK